MIGNMRSRKKADMNNGRLEIDHHIIEPLYFIAFDPLDMSSCHYGKLMTLHCVGSGQKEMEDFDNQSDWISRLLDFGIIIDPLTDMEA